MIQLARKGANGRHWYKSEKEYWQTRFRPEEFFAVLAALSPRHSADRNLDLALRVMYGMPVSLMKAHRMNVDRALAGEPLSGPKVRAFFLALMGDPDAVVVDRRMCRAAGLNTDNPSKSEYAYVEGMVREAALELGWTPAETQAAVWSAVSSRGTNLPFRELGRLWHGQWLPGMGAER